MNIVIISNFLRLGEGTIVDRFLYLGEMLSERGHQVRMIVSDFNHDEKKHSFQKIHGSYKTKIIPLHEPGYSSNISLKRLWSHYYWGKRVGQYLNNVEKTNLVYCAIPSLTASVKAARYCKKVGAKFVIDVQDLWPEAFTMAIHNNLLQKGFFPITWYVNKAYSAADLIVAVSNTYANRALSVNKKESKGLSVFLGSDRGVFDKARNSHMIERPTNVLQICYIGTLSYSYDLKCAIDGISYYNKVEGVPPMRFIVMGGGPLAGEFEQYAKEKKVNAVFTGALPYPEMVARMCRCDILINPIVEGAAQSITNKVGDYALAGLPVVNTQENPEYRYYLDKYQCGFNCRVGSAEDVGNVLVKLAQDPKLRKQMGENARKFGIEKFDRQYTYTKIIDAIEGLVKCVEC